MKRTTPRNIFVLIARDYNNYFHVHSSTAYQVPVYPRHNTSCMGGGVLPCSLLGDGHMDSQRPSNRDKRPLLYKLSSTFVVVVKLNNIV